MTWKLVVAYLGWLLAASALALLFGELFAELLALARVVDSGSEARQTTVEVAAITCFIVLALLPFLLRNRIIRSDGE